MTAQPIRLGFIPLIDAAALIVAKEKGFAAREDLDLDLRKEGGWAAVRDKVAYGLLDGAHMLAGLPLAGRLGLSGQVGGIIAPMALGLGGNAITVSNTLHAEMTEADPEAMAQPGAETARALAKVIAARRERGRERLSFATVHPFSSHNYELRYWLAAANVDPDRDLDLGIIAPQRMTESLASGWIQGYCVGEPWNLAAEGAGAGRVVARKTHIWPWSPEKVLGVNATWAERETDTLLSLIRVLVEGARWADDPDNRPELADILAQAEYLNTASSTILASLSMGNHVFHALGATYPWRAQGSWLLSQMARWRQAPTHMDCPAVLDWVYRADLYREAMGDRTPLPETEPVLLGAHPEPYDLPSNRGVPFRMAADRFSDGALFDAVNPIPNAAGGMSSPPDGGSRD